MKVADLVRENTLLILPQLRGRTRDDVLAELAEFLAAHHNGLDARDVLRSLSERERLGSTAVEGGLAIPHAKVADAHKLVACFGRSVGGVEFGAPDGLPSRFFFVLIAPAGAPGEHLTALARISRLFRDPRLRDRLDGARGAEEIYQVLAEGEGG